MKKLATILFATLYLQASVGVAVNLHFCMGQLASTGFFVESKGCLCEDFEKEGKCCDDESYFYQLDDEQDLVKTTEIKAPIVAYVLLYISLSDQTKEAKPKVNHELYDLPPPSKPPIWLIICSPTLYG